MWLFLHFVHFAELFCEAYESGTDLHAIICTQWSPQYTVCRPCVELMRCIHCMNCITINAGCRALLDIKRLCSCWSVGTFVKRLTSCIGRNWRISSIASSSASQSKQK